MKKILLLLFSSSLFFACGSDIKVENNSLGNTELKSLEKLINDSVYPATIKHERNKITVNLKTPVTEIYFESRMVVTCERIVLLLKNEVPKIDSLLINFEVPEAKGEPNIRFYDQRTMTGVIQFNETNKMYHDFNSYIFKNLNGSKLEQFTIYLKVLKSVEPKSVPTVDYIETLYNYIDETQNKSKGDTTKKVIEALKKLIVDTQEWKGYNPTDVDYFLNYK
jgi:hypothetical protein